MESLQPFIAYYEKTRSVTNKVVRAIPPDKMDWAYLPGKFTFADLLRHIAAIERYVFMELIQGKKSMYRGCGKVLADGYENVIAYFNEMHRQSITILSTLKEEALPREIKTLTGQVTSTENFLKALIVHEVHHRASLCIYLNMVGVRSPPVIGLTEEQVIELSK